MLTGRVEISQTKCVCSQDKLRLAWIENLGLYQLEISIRRQRSCGCRAKMSTTTGKWQAECLLSACDFGRTKTDQTTSFGKRPLHQLQKCRVNLKGHTLGLLCQSASHNTRSGENCLVQKTLQMRPT